MDSGTDGTDYSRSYTARAFVPHYASPLPSHGRRAFFTLAQAPLPGQAGTAHPGRGKPGEIYTNQTTPTNHFLIKTKPNKAHDRTEAQARLPPVFLNTAGGPPQMGRGLYRRPRPASCVPRNACVKECALQW